MIYSCKKCEITLCQNSECKKSAEKTICHEKQVKKAKGMIKSSPTSVFVKQKSSTNFVYLIFIFFFFFFLPLQDQLSNKLINSTRGSGLLKRKLLMLQTNSEQILPIKDIHFSPRGRSFSDPDNSSLFDTKNVEKHSKSIKVYLH